MTTKTFHRGLRDLKIAAWTAENTYGAFYDILGARDMSVNWVVEGDQLIGDDVVLDRYSKATSVTVKFENGAVDFTVIDMILGGTLTSTAAYEDLMITENDEVPYVALAGRVVGSGGTADLHILIPKAKISNNIQLSAQHGTYVLPSAEFIGVDEGPINGMMRLRKFSAPTALEIPLKVAVGL